MYLKRSAFVVADGILCSEEVEVKLALFRSSF